MMSDYIVQLQKSKKGSKQTDKVPQYKPSLIEQQQVIRQDVVIMGKKFEDQDFPDLGYNGNSKASQSIKQQERLISATSSDASQIIQSKKIIPNITESNSQKFKKQSLNSNEIKQLNTKYIRQIVVQQINEKQGISDKITNEDTIFSNIVRRQQEQNLFQQKDIQLKNQIQVDEEKTLDQSEIQKQKVKCRQRNKKKIEEKQCEVQITQVKPDDEDDEIEKDFDDIFSKNGIASSQLRFKCESLSYVFCLLLNESKCLMKEMKDSYKDEADYLGHVVPLFVNETLHDIKSQSEDMMSRFQMPGQFIPLRHIFEIDTKLTVLGKFLVIKGIEGKFDIVDDYMQWKKWNYTEYLDFKESYIHVVQVLIPRQVQKHGEKDHVDLLGVMKKGNKKECLIYFPWNKRNIDAFKIPNIQIYDSDFTDNCAAIHHKSLMRQYKALQYPNLEELYTSKFLGYLNPIFNPCTYLIEIKALMDINNSPLFKCILKPQDYINKKSISTQSLQFGKQMNQTVDAFFKNQKIDSLYNKSQKQAIIHACDYDYPVTIINGPPGTGKTFTSLGIMSIIVEHIEQRGLDGIILACAHSNTVINDWVRKIGRGSNESNSLMDSKGREKKAKVLRIGLSDKCDSDILDYSLDVQCQRIFFQEKLFLTTKQEILELFPDVKPQSNCYTLSNIKTKINQTSSKYHNKNNSTEEKELIKKQSKTLKDIFQTMKQFLEKFQTDYKLLQSQLISDTQIIVSTLSSSSSKTIREYLSKHSLPVQLLIIDEAPQCFEPSTLIPIASHEVSKLVLIGDDKQLGPIIHDYTNSTKYQYSRSLYERFMANGMKDIMLNRQYRSLPSLSTFTSTFFYDGQLSDDPSLVQKQLPDYLNGILKMEKNFLFFDLEQGAEVRAKGGSFVNQHEAEAVVFLVKYLLQKYKGSEQIISVVSPYKAQVQLIKTQMKKEIKDELLINCVEINTVDSFQGKENDIMIISLVRSDGIGFLRDSRRVNVATSRAQYAQYIFGNSNALLRDPLWCKIYSYLRTNGKIIEYNFNSLGIKSIYFKHILMI